MASMGEKDQAKLSTPNTGDADDLSGLSSDERSAFEKIMAEISMSSNEDPPAAKTASTTSSSSKTKADPKNQLPKNDLPTAPASSDNQETSDSSTEELSAEQQAVLEQIMSEIQGSSKEDFSNTPTVKTEPATAEAEVSDPEALTEEQQAALDQIMAEIQGNPKDTSTKSDPVTVENPDPEALSEDQQAALDQIMADIQNPSKTEKKDDIPPKKDVPSAEDEAPTDELSDDQQAALSQILAEIESKKNRPDIASEAMEEVSKKSATDALPEAAPALEAAKPIENLSMDEFSDELEQLLSSKPSADPSEASPRPSQTLKPEQPIDTAHPIKPPKVNSIDKPSTAELKITQPAVSMEKQPTIPELHEVVEADEEAGDTAKSKTGRKMGKSTRPTGASKSKLTRSLYAIGILLAIAGFVGGGYWGYLRYVSRPQTNLPTDNSEATAVPQTTAAHQSKPADAATTGSDLPWPLNPSKPESPQRPTDPLTQVMADVTATQANIRNKFKEIEELKAYYTNGISEDISKIALQLHGVSVPDFSGAMNNKTIELGIRSIQRRKLYLSKLDTPLAQLANFSEQFLFWQRHIQLYQTLNTHLSGVPISDLQAKIATAQEQFRAYSAQLSIDDIQATPMALETLWQQIAPELNKRSQQTVQNTPRNQAIGQEICQGNFERKFLITALSADTARCLIKWNGKDLYLNELSELTAEVAQILAQWKGEWLSLNGLTTLSADAARSLAAWPGKRLSLNGLISLSPEVTRNLSQWKGAQIELIGLQSIGSWENYTTRLFLSEKLRRQLEMQ